MIELTILGLVIAVIIIGKIYDTLKTRYFLIALQYRDFEFNIRFLEIQLKSDHGKFPQRSSIRGYVVGKFPDINQNLLTIQNIYEFKNLSDFDSYGLKENYSVNEISDDK